MSLLYSCLLASVCIMIIDGADTYFGENNSEKDQCDGDTCNQDVTVNTQKVDPEEINVIITFTNAASNSNLQTKFKLTVSSILEHATVPLRIQIIGDPKSQSIASEILKQSSANAKTTYKVRNTLMPRYDFCKVLRFLKSSSMCF